MPHKKDASIACAEQVVMLTEADLPLCCPSDDERLWDAHPRVYIDMPAIGEASCPYCGTRYIMESCNHSASR